MTKLAYILAASHSGSTLLSMLLGSQPQIATVGELKLSTTAMGRISRYRCSCGEFIRECQFWHKVKQGMDARGFEFDIACASTDYRAVDSRYARRLLDPMYSGMFLECVRDIALSLSPAWRKRISEIHKRNAALVSTIAEIARAEVVVDSSKNALRLKYLLKNPELVIKVIHLVRDGRAVALTYMDPAEFADAQDPSQRGGGIGSNLKYHQLTMAQAAYEWCRGMKEAESILRCLSPSQWIEIHYEDYCKNPDVTLSRLQRFLGVEPGKPHREFRTFQQHVVGNGMRLDTTSKVSLDERWKSVLSEENLRIFERAAGEMNYRYGYE